MCDCWEQWCSFCTDQVDNWIEWQGFCETVKDAYSHNPNYKFTLRYGQQIYNGLCDYRPDIARKLSGSIVDPFHNDEKVPEFLEKVDELWML